MNKNQINKTAKQRVVSSYRCFVVSLPRPPVPIRAGRFVVSLSSYCAIIFIAVFLFAIPVTFAQTGFSPPTLLPGDEAVEGYGNVCIGLADAIRTGDLHLRHIPCFIKYFSQTLIGIAGTLAVIFVMIGGYQYVLGSDDQKDKAKNTILYALIGLVVTLMAWILVDIVLQFATE